MKSFSPTIFCLSFALSLVMTLPVAAFQVTHVPQYTFQGDFFLNIFGWSVSGVGDVNGDGLDDFIVGAPWNDSNGDRSGSAYVYSGLDGSILYTFDGDSAGEQFGRSVSDAGDVNGDGRADFIIGAPYDNNNGLAVGSARVFSGLDGSVIHTFYGDAGGFGETVSGAGDLNGDGRDDLIVGAPFDNANGAGRGSVQVFSGLDGSILYTFNGDNDGDRFGSSLSGAGDVNGDGRADLIIGASKGLGFGNLGSTRVLSGLDGSVLYSFDGDSGIGWSVSGAGDVNGDGRADLIVGAPGGQSISDPGSARVLSGLDGSILYTFDGDGLFGWSVSGAGDVNGDGRADLIVGAFSEDTNNGLSSGTARVFSGLDGSILYTFDGDHAGFQFGRSVSGVGDINGDGLADFIVGASGGNGRARVFVSQVVAEVLLGDVNQDEAVDFLDIAPFIALLSANDFQVEADVNEDGSVTFLDIGPFIQILSEQ